MPELTSARTRTDRVEQLLASFPALCFFYSLSCVDAHHLEGAHADPHQLDGMSDDLAQD